MFIMQSLLAVLWVLFILMLILDVIGCVNLVRVLKMHSKERLQNLLFGLTVAVLLTLYFGLLLFAPGHHDKAWLPILLVGGCFTIAFLFRQVFKPAKEGNEER